MTKPNIYKLDFEIDKLTDSILNTISGDSFRTEISLLTKSDLKTITKSRGWLFDWKYEFNQPDREVYKLTIVDNPDIVQGMISFTVRTDHVYMFLLESAPFNLGKKKLYEGVDFLIKSKSLTEKQEKELSEFIAKRKLEIKKKSKKGTYAQHGV